MDKFASSFDPLLGRSLSISLAVPECFSIVLGSRRSPLTELWYPHISNREGFKTRRRSVSRIMQWMGLEAIYRKPRTGENPAVELDSPPPKAIPRMKLQAKHHLKQKSITTRNFIQSAKESLPDGISQNYHITAPRLASLAVKSPQVDSVEKQPPPGTLLT